MKLFPLPLAIEEMCGSIHKGTMYFSCSVTLLSISYSVYQWGILDKDAGEVLVFASNIRVFFSI